MAEGHWKMRKHALDTRRLHFRDGAALLGPSCDQLKVTLHLQSRGRGLLATHMSRRARGGLG